MLTAKSIESIEASLPNGFHDSVVESIAIDYRRREVVLELQVEVGADDVSYRPCKLVIGGLCFIVIDASKDARGALDSDLILDSGSGQPSTAPIPFDLDESCFLHWFFVSRWNGFIRVAAKEASLEWR